LKIDFTARSWDEYRALREADPSAFRKLEALIEECRRNPFKGTGKPEPLKDNLKGFWSRRITQEHRLVYRVRGTGDDQVLEIAQCRSHY
jgi:toxin YoeB